MYLQWYRFNQQMRNFGIPIVPLPKGQWKILGVIPLVKKNMYRIYDFRVDLFRELKSPTIIIPGPIWNPNPHIATLDPALVKHILGRETYENWLKSSMGMNNLRDFMGYGIFTINHGPFADDKGERWLKFRKTAAKIFTRDNFRNSVYDVFVDDVVVLVNVMMDKIAANHHHHHNNNQSQVIIDVQQLMFKFTLDAIGMIGFGVHLHTLTSDVVPFAKAFDEAQKHAAHRQFMPGWRIPILGKLLYTSEREHAKNCTTLLSFSNKVIKDRRVEQSRFGSAQDILSLFMNEQEVVYSDDDLRDVVMSFLIAGRDTTACTIFFALLLLAHNPQVQDKLRTEILTTIPLKLMKNGLKLHIPTYDDLASGKNPILKGCVMESLRLFPPVPIDGKQAFHDDVLPNGIRVPAGTRITFEPWVVGHVDKTDVGLEQYGWEHAMEFKPERWSEMKKEPSPFSFPQFQGGGPRVCLGEQMAKFEAQFVLAVLIGTFKFSLPPTTSPGDQIEYIFGTTLTGKDGRMKVEVFI
jgi:cytochrome P450